MSSCIFIIICEQIQPKAGVIECCERALCVGKTWEVRVLCCGIALSVTVCDVRVDTGEILQNFLNDGCKDT